MARKAKVETVKKPDTKDLIVAQAKALGFTRQTFTVDDARVLIQRYGYPMPQTDGMLRMFTNDVCSRLPFPALQEA